MDQKKLLFLYNTHAGQGQAALHLAAIQEALTRSGWLVTARPTLDRGDAAVAAAELGPAYDRLICCGGDGTLHEVVQGLMPLQTRPVVGYIPAGSTNDFAKNLRLPRGFSEMAATAAAGVPRPIDIGRFNERYFVYVAAFGAFTDVAYATPQPFKNLCGRLAYLLEGLVRLPSLKSYPLTVEHDGGKLEGEFLYGMVSNTDSVGGFRGLAGRDVALDDGLFEVVLVRQPKKWGDLRRILATLLQQGKEPSELVLTFRTSRLEVACGEELSWTLDGEFGGAPERVTIENCKQAITIVHGS